MRLLVEIASPHYRRRGPRRARPARVEPRGAHVTSGGHNRFDAMVVSPTVTCG